MNHEYVASSSSSSSSFHSDGNHKNYDVFISFRGKDTRNGFISHLQTSLRQQSVDVFNDNEQLERGEEISSSILKTIEHSKISIVIFSQNYADSAYCLDELVKIMECRRDRNQIVMPVFYLVNPEDVEEQKGSFGMALAKHEVDLKVKERVQGWKAALNQITYISGWDSRNIRPDSLLIEEITKAVTAKLWNMYCDIPSYDNEDYYSAANNYRGTDDHRRGRAGRDRDHETPNLSASTNYCIDLMRSTMDFNKFCTETVGKAAIAKQKTSLLYGGDDRLPNFAINKAYHDIFRKHEETEKRKEIARRKYEMRTRSENK